MLLRSQIDKAVRAAKEWFFLEEDKGEESIIYESAKNHLRGGNFIIWFDEAIYKLDHINFYYDCTNDINAETDGIQIWINTYQKWDHNLLVNTLIHEALHFTIRTNGKYDISEKKEHRIMLQIDPNLINY